MPHPRRSLLSSLSLRALFSEAIPSRLGDCFVAPLLAMTENLTAPRTTGECACVAIGAQRIQGSGAV